MASIRAATHVKASGDGVPAPRHDDAGGNPMSTAHDHDIVTTAEGSHRLGTFVDFVRAAGLTGLLRTPGPFTVFAPTDRAFAKISQPRLDALLADRNRLVAFMRHHVVTGRVAAPKSDADSVATTIDGQSHRLTSRAGVYRVGEARLVQTSIPATNGVIHAIDAVLMAA